MKLRLRIIRKQLQRHVIFDVVKKSKGFVVTVQSVYFTSEVSGDITLDLPSGR